MTSRQYQYTNIKATSNAKKKEKRRKHGGSLQDEKEKTWLKKKQKISSSIQETQRRWPPLLIPDSQQGRTSGMWNVACAALEKQKEGRKKEARAGIRTNGKKKVRS
ncbi:uncharacterized protein ARB_06607 [Trichophyton benhamiae CBS 112371]|uniref:Uncharacterized protein n=1 Tax=Arthroderma benhamiae (strain ATCC MYA-4681 / CBS 112371) TaxID=663331 RepID=D4AQU7_ARTBC|nr:uncharacterized protein ARB_06607 [Trichophyton benhamiae CBS 112371]EFE34841.1 hypothetical protein ARB_06607 [Trichophyton benhamiae CBS 112371]